MEVVTSFTVPISPEDTWKALLDFGRVARAMPGAEIKEVNGNEVVGSVAVRLGPMKVEYQGIAVVDDSDPDCRQLLIDANGSETRGSGAASAKIRTQLTPVDQGTNIDLVAKVDISGRPAQMGGALIQEVATRLTDEFAQRLRDDLVNAEAASGPNVNSQMGSGDLDLLKLAAGPVMRRVAIVGTAILVLRYVWKLLR